MTAGIAALATFLSVWAGPVAANSEGFAVAETSRLSQQQETVEAIPLSAATRTERYTHRSELMIELDTARFALNHHAGTWASFTEDRQRLGRHIAGLNGVQRKIDTSVERIERLEEEITAVEASLITDDTVADLDNFGLDYAVFPIEETTEFVDSWGAARSGGRGHKGTDILGPYGSELRAIEDGVIERTSNSALGGLSLYLKGDSGARYFYAHLSSFADISDGDRVYAGEVVGLNGDSGNARGTPHLHFQWAPDGGESWRNPYALLEAVWAQDRQVSLPRR
ncbi:MAG: M23 family metallopeptidase [Acidimicrobiales bacterium]